MLFAKRLLMQHRRPQRRHGCRDRSRLTVFVVMLASTFFAESGRVQTAQARNADGRTVLDGVYTAAQANRGKAHYEVNCRSCHGADLSGGSVRALAGEDFISNWRGVKLDSMFDRVRTMPPVTETNAAVRLADEAYLDIITYVLEVNGFPAGTEELTPKMLTGILIEGNDGPQPVPNFALVQVVGCLTRGPDGTWVVTDASEPVRTKDPEASKDDELKDVGMTALGTRTFRLLNVYPNPDAYEGHTVETKGFLIRGPDDSVNVTALENLGPTCGR